MRFFLTSRNAAFFAAIASVVLVLAPVAAEAQNSLGIGRPEQAITPEGPFASLLYWIQQQQQGFYRAMTGELKALGEDATRVWMLAGLSFAYGVFHAAGPGHGKAVISSYMLANELAARRGVLLAFASAFVQAITAIVVIAALMMFLRGSGIKQGDATRWLEIASYAGVTALGAWLLWKKTFGGGAFRVAPVAPALAHAHAGAAMHEHGHHRHDRSHERHHGHGHDDHHHHHHGHDAHSHGGHVHGSDCGCGHSHAPDPSLLEKDFGLRQAWTAILAVGLRPCTGALIVLTFAFLNGLWFAGIASTFAMALGTGITVAALAAMAVWAKDLAIRVGGAAERGAAIHRAVEIGGAALVLLLGVTLLSAALAA